MRKALVVGIDHYRHLARLHGCVNDSATVRAALERHADGRINFGVKHLTSTPGTHPTRQDLLQAVRELFAGDAEVALFYFAGHGFVGDVGGYLLSGESQTGDDGLSLDEIMTLANKSDARHRVLVLDSCHSGHAGNSAMQPSVATLAEGTTILTASTAKQYATEENGSGVFTSLFVDGLDGSAATLTGDISPGGLYAHIDRSLGPWDQRPVFKTHVKSFVSLRSARPTLEDREIRELLTLFPKPGCVLPLDPSYEPESPAPDAENTRRFAILQKCNRVNLVVPVGATHMYHAAMQSKACKLTALGEHYRRLVERGLL